MRTRPRRALAGLLAAAIAACAPSGEPVSAGDAGGFEPAARSTAQATAEAASEAPPFPWEAAALGEDVPASVPLDEIRSGGPPPDGIPPIDDPVFETVDAAAEWLEPQDPVMVVAEDGDVRGYPLAILTFHEIVNDEIGGRPVLVTYCPLCNSGLAFDRRVDGEVLDFGTSGRLYRSNLVMYDRATRSLWAQFTGEAIVGPRTGQTLQRLPMQIAAFDQVADAWPDARMLSRETGHSRPYGTNPYAGYDTSARPFLFDGETDGPLPQIERVVTTGGAQDPVAYPLSVLREDRVVHDTVAGTDAVVLWAPGTASALDTDDLSEGRDVGTAGVFSRVPVPSQSSSDLGLDGRALTFERDGDAFADTETGSRWTVLGLAVSGPLAGTQLERITHDDTFWFVQYAFRPETRVWPEG